MKIRFILFHMIELKMFAPKGSSQEDDIKLEAELTRENDSLKIRYVLSGNVNSVMIPVPSKTSRSSVRTDELWKNTCFEIFISEEKSKKYWEYNFSPTTAWNCYSFDDYRIESKSQPKLAGIPITFKKTDSLFELTATIKLPAAFQKGEASLTAVIEKDIPKRERLSYWASAHMASAPDFHLRKSFTTQF